MATGQRKKLIEVVLPLAEINEGARPETENPFLKGHPRAIHNWWARTPLSVARAVLFSQLVDDPGNDLPEEEAAVDRERLLDVVRDLAAWEATNDDALLGRARAILSAQYGESLPEFWDMFSGRGSLPLEAQRLGLRVTSTDLNPVAVLIQRCLLDYPQRFAGRPPVCPAGDRRTGTRGPHEGLRQDTVYYGQWIQKRAEVELKGLYPGVLVTSDLVADRPDLRLLKGGTITPLAWLWARTIQCPNPACGARTPLIASWTLSRRNKVCIAPAIDRRNKVADFSRIRSGPSPVKPTSTRCGATCLFCATRLNKTQLRAQAVAHGVTETPLAIVCQGPGGCVYLPFLPAHVPVVFRPAPGILAQPIAGDARWFSPPLYGLRNFSDLFTARQLTALMRFAALIEKAREQVLIDSARKQLGPEDERRLGEGGRGLVAYADALAVYLACALSRLTDYSCSLATWNPTNENVGHLFQRQAIPMVWDFAEANILSGKLTFATASEWVSSALASLPGKALPARVAALDARTRSPSFATCPVVSTDPPYFDNIGYADLSDFFSIWLRLSLGSIDPDLFPSTLTPKDSELIASRCRQGGCAEDAERFFRKGFATVCRELYAVAHPDVPLTIYYASRRSDARGEETQPVSAGWESMLEGLVSAGFQVTGTVPVRTTKKARSVARGTNALASAIVIVCRRRPSGAQAVPHKAFVAALRREFPPAVRNLQRGSLAPVDLAQAAVGLGMAVFTRFARVMEPDGSSMGVRSALQWITQTLDEILHQDRDLDEPTRWAAAWFLEFGMEEGPISRAETILGAKTTAIARWQAGKVRLIPREQLAADGAQGAGRITVWSATQRLIHALDRQGECGAARLLRQLGGTAKTAEAQRSSIRQLAYRLYSVCERKGWTAEARAYNELVVAWPEMVRLSLAHNR